MAIRKNSSPDSKRKVVITGIGVISPIGIGKREFYRNLRLSKTGVDRISYFDASGFPSQLAAEVKNFDPRVFLNKGQVKRFSRVTQFACAAASLAFDDSQLKDIDPSRTDAILGSASCAFDEVNKQIFRNPTAGKEWVDGSFQKTSLGLVNMGAPACAVSLMFQLKGHVTTLSSACASGLNAVGIASERIEDGRADIAFAGGVDCAVNHFTLNIFSAAGALNTFNEDPEKALCPFDERRTRSVLAEGAAVFILEEKNHALARSARIYCEVDTFVQEYENINELYMLDLSGKNWASTIEKTVQDCKDRIGFINAHAPSDFEVDMVESRALMSVFKDCKAKLPVSSIKGSTGSALGAAGALQLASSALTLESKIIPPNYNYLYPDPECDLNITTSELKVPDLSHVLINSHGFGGVNISMVVKESSL